MLKFLDVLTALLLAMSYSAVNVASPQNLLDYEGDVQEEPTSNAAESSDIPAKLYEGRVSTPILAGSTSAPSQPRNGGLKMTKIRSGVIDSDDFNDGVLDYSTWANMQHPEILPTESGGFLVVRGTPSPQANEGWHAGAMTTRAASAGLPDLVMAVKYLLPNWDYSCTMDWHEFPIYEVHLCNENPDVNHSIRIQRLCPTGASTEATFGIGGLNSTQLPKEQINTQGVEMFVSYNDGVAQAYMLDKDRVVHTIGGGKTVLLANHKRMELKANLTPRGVEVFLKVDWAVLYPQPLDVPARIKIAGLAATKIEVKVGDWKGVYPVSDGVATFKLPAKRIYPSAATVTVFNGKTPLGILKIQRKNDLDGLYPGDIWKIAKK